METKQQHQQVTIIVTENLERNPAEVYLAGLDIGSRPAQARALDVIAEIASHGNATRFTLAWTQLTFAHTSAIRAELASRYAPATANRMLSALRQVLETAWRLDLMTAEDYQRAADLRVVKGETLPAGRSLTPGELAALLGACGPDPAGVRDAAVIGCMYCGLRRAEVVSLDLRDFNQVSGELRVQGKGKKQRSVPLVGGVDRMLADWLAVRGDRPGPLFVQIRRGGHLQRERMTARAVNHILSERAEAAGVANVTPHDFRRSVIGDLLDAGADIVTVANLVGHANVQTTRRYDRRGERAKRDAAKLVHLPYTRRVLR